MYIILNMDQNYCLLMTGSLYMEMRHEKAMAYTPG